MSADEVRIKALRAIRHDGVHHGASAILVVDRKTAETLIKHGDAVAVTGGYAGWEAPFKADRNMRYR